MDILDRRDAEIQEKREWLAMRNTPRATRAEGPHTDMPLSDYPVTVIGCIRGFDGWYQAGYDHRKETIVPMERIQTREINKDCPVCVRSDPKTGICFEAGTIHGGTPCIYWFPRRWHNSNKTEDEAEQ